MECFCAMTNIAKNKRRRKRKEKKEGLAEKPDKAS